MTAIMVFTQIASGPEFGGVMALWKRSVAELIGTFWWVLGGCGAAVIACVVGNPYNGIGYLGVALAFGLTVLTMAYAIGHISGCHLNPAVSVGLFVSGRFKGVGDLISYIVAQCIGGILGAGVIYIIVNPQFGADAAIGTFATNGWSEELVNGVNAFGGKAVGLTAAFTAEAVLTCFFLLVIIGSTDKRAPAALAPVAIGLCLTLIHLIAIPITNTSVNPARSLAVAAYVGGTAVSQLWLFWVAPIIGAIVAGIIYKCIFEEKAACVGEDCHEKKDDCKNCDDKKTVEKAEAKKEEKKAEVKKEEKKAEAKKEEKKAEVKKEEKKAEVKKEEKKAEVKDNEEEDEDDEEEDEE
ncbi:MAG: aquaporin Z [Bradymonadales bacterium]